MRAVESVVYASAVGRRRGCTPIENLTGVGAIGCARGWRPTLIGEKRRAARVHNPRLLPGECVDGEEQDLGAMVLS